MITVDHVLEACEIRKQLSAQAPIITIFIFEHQPSGDDQSTPRLHLFAEIDAGYEPRLKSSNSFFIILASPYSYLICPMCHERLSPRRFAAHVNKHKIRKLPISESLHNKSEAYIQSRIDSLSKAVILPKLDTRKKKKKRRKTLVFSAGAPGLGKKS